MSDQCECNQQHDWDADAEKAANFASSALAEVTPGVGPWTDETAVIFGHDVRPQGTLADVIYSQLQIDLLRQRLSDAGIEELGFAWNQADCDVGGGDDDVADVPFTGLRNTWAMIVRFGPTTGNLAWLQKQAIENGDVAAK
jgi:hypothetical protein